MNRMRARKDWDGETTIGLYLRYDDDNGIPAKTGEYMVAVLTVITSPVEQGRHVREALTPDEARDLADRLRRFADEADELNEACKP